MSLHIWRARVDAQKMQERSYYVYILASKSRVLYVGITRHLWQRIREHRAGIYPGFTTKYKVYRLVHFEPFGSPSEAIKREKQLKGWRREKKIRLIERENSTWEDLSAEWGKQVLRLAGRRPLAQDDGL